MFHYIAIFAITLSLWLPAHAAPAPLPNSDVKHAENAFIHADRENWHDAVLHSMRTKHTLLRDIITWKALLAENSGYDFTAYQHFLARNHDWPKEKRLIIRAESALFAKERPDVDAVLQWFDAHPPITGKGKRVYAEALIAKHGDTYNKKQVHGLIRDAWINGDFNAEQERAIIKHDRALLDTNTHIARAKRLLWEDKIFAAERMLNLLPKGQRALAEARIKLKRNSRNVTLAINRVPAALQSDLGLTYDRMKWRERKRLHDGVREMLYAAPQTVPYPGKWWATRRYQVREALERGQTSRAMKLLQNHGQTEGIGRAEALWLMGWINLTFLQRPEQAIISFKAMEEGVSYPVSLARAGYWLGRAYDASDNRSAALESYKRAAAFYTTFYGQMAALRVQQRPAIRLPRHLQASTVEKRAFEADPRVQAVHLLAKMGRYEDARTFILGLMDTATDQAERQRVASLGTTIGKTHFGVQAAKNAMKSHTVLPQSGYPYYQLPFTPPVEEALIWAITRQESLFQLSAKSRSGARGLMQLMPRTARGVARKLGQPYSRHRLEDAVYNLRLGSHYIREVLDRFDGSYVLAIASYNAGPGRAQEWVSTFGQPGNSPEAIVNWIERIPYKETRNYVQRVLENVQVYRAILDTQDGRYIRLNEDLMR